MSPIAGFLLERLLMSEQSFKHVGTLLVDPDGDRAIVFYDEDDYLSPWKARYIEGIATGAVEDLEDGDVWWSLA